MAYGPPVPLSGMQLHLQRRNMSFINDGHALNLGGFIESRWLGLKLWSYHL